MFRLAWFGVLLHSAATMHRTPAAAVLNLGQTYIQSDTVAGRCTHGVATWPLTAHQQNVDTQVTRVHLHNN